VRRLAIFDFDGTLARSTGVDDRCFCQMLERVFGLDIASPDWSDFPHATDSDLTRSVPMAFGLPEPTDDQVRRARDAFIELTTQAIQRDPSAARPMPGADAFVSALRDRGWHAAIATGAWRGTFEVKLRATGLDVSHLPSATADDGRVRTDIVRAAIGRVGSGPFDRVVAFGDGVWDTTTARELGMAFVGVTAEGDRDKMARAGADTFLPDFADLDAAMRALESAGVPS